MRTDLTHLDLTPVTDPATDGPHVAVAYDAPTGRALIALDAAAVDALDSLLDSLPLAHDLVDGGYTAAAAAVASALQAAVGRVLRPHLHS